MGWEGQRKENLEEFQWLVIGSNPELYNLSSIRFTCLSLYREMSFGRSNVEQRERWKRVPTTNKTDTRRPTLDSLLSLMEFHETFRPPFLYNWWHIISVLVFRRARDFFLSRRMPCSSDFHFRNFSILICLFDVEKYIECEKYMEKLLSVCSRSPFNLV